MKDNQSHDYVNAIEDFRRARSQADLKELLSRLTGESNQLLSFDEVRQMLRLQGGTSRGVQDIPLDAIVGSVGRYTDFTRDFLPRSEVQPERWARVRVAASDQIGLPPIDVYKIGEVYFVQDGNHRVSVARQFGAKHIQAYVTEVHTHIALTPDVQPDDLILKAEQSEFLEQTNLAHLRPEADFSITVPGQYLTLLDHINVHRYFMGIDFQRPITFEEAVTHWYDQVYLPVVEAIRKQGILREFPNRTETDLYIWISEHRAQLEQEFGFNIRTEYVIGHLADEDRRENWISRLGEKIIDLIVPENLAAGPPVGRWRDQVQTRSEDRLFCELLVPVNGKDDGWCALEQAIRVAQRECTTLHGLHVVTPGGESDIDLQKLQEQFNQRCKEANVKGDLVVSEGEIVEQTTLRAAVTDLVIVNLSYPPGEQPIARLTSGFRNLLNQSPRPVLATPQTVSNLNHALLCYDGSPKAREALFVATYLARRWGTQLDVLTVEDGGRVDEDTLQEAESYLNDHGVQSGYILKSGDPGEQALKTCQDEQCDLIIMGSYGLTPVFEVMLGSAVDQVLRLSSVPTLICR